MASTVLSMSKGMRETWTKIGKKQRNIILIGVGLAFIASIITLVLASQGPKYDILWSNLDPNDAAAIVSELDAQSIPYQLEAGGSTILIPSDKVYKTRLSLASAGLPSSGIVGFESIAQGGIWATDFDRKVQYVRALSGELTRTVKGIAGVEDARVHIVLPEPSVFATQNRPATAAVLIKTRPMQEISSATVKGIINLVACSVEGLSPKDVAVVDSNGRLLSQDYAGSLGEAGELSNAAFEITTKVERELESRLMSLLSPVLGAGNVVCQVRAELALDQVRITDTSYPTDPQTVIRSTEQRTESYKGSGAPPGGQAGGLDVPSYSTTSTGDSQYQSTETVTNYEVSEKVTETLVTPGQIKRLSVAVVVNKELDEASRSTIADTVSAALGLDPSRQDTINISGVPFDTSLAEEIQKSLTPATGEETTMRKVYIYGAAVALALVVGTIILFLTRRKRPQEMPAPVTVEAPQEDEMPDLLGRIGGSGKSVQESVERMARANPAMVAALIKSWILEDER